MHLNEKTNTQPDPPIAMGREFHAKPSTSSAGDSALSRFTLITKGIDVTPLLSELASAPEMWLADTSRQRMGG